MYDAGVLCAVVCLWGSRGEEDTAVSERIDPEMRIINDS